MNIAQRPSFDFSVIGGDKRQAYISEILAKNGYRVLVYAIDGESIEGCRTAITFAQAIEEGRNIIAPIPLINGEAKIPHKTENNDLTLENLKKYIQSGQRLFAGCISEEDCQFFHEKNVTCYDFMEEDTIAIFNSIATAEGIIAEAIIGNPINLHNSNCLILGYGRCGKTLADKLKAISAKTTVSVREEGQKAAANACGHETIALSDLEQEIGRFDFIFNTIPAVILRGNLLKRVKPDTAIFDIASAPGGVDYVKAHEYRVSAGIYLGLPGKYSPQSSAIALTDFVVKRMG